MGLTQVSKDGVKNDAIDASKLPTNSVGASELADNAVDTNAIADQAVALSKLPHGDGSSDGKFLRANNGADPSFESIPASGISNLVEDTSPQLGGDLQSNGNDILFADNDSAKFGAGVDLELKSNGTNGIVHSPTGHLRLQTTGSDKNIILENASTGEYYGIFKANGGVDLYHDNNIRFQTHSDGVSLRSTNYNSSATHWSEGGFKPWANNTYDLGDASYRWRALHINQGIYFGGNNTAATQLDDYEQGTWTPANDNFSTYTSVTWDATYTKIGNIVHCNAVQTGGTTDWSINQSLTGIPFAVAKTGAGSWTNNAPSDGGEVLIWSDERIYFAQSRASVSSAHKLRITFTYQTT